MGAADEASFDEFFRKSSRRLLGQAYLLTADVARSQDLTQEAFERAWLRWDTVSTYDDPEAWVRRILHNLCISDWRKRVRRSDRRSAPARVVPPPGEDHLVLLEALRSLTPDHAKALVLHDGLGFTAAQIAVDMSVPEGTVRSWIARARAHAASALIDLGHSYSGDVR